MGMSKHTSPVNLKDEWLTPREIFVGLGDFDLDPCSPIKRPWNTAKNHYTLNDDGLKKPWCGRVWCNPPYGKETGKWLDKAADHNNCICLVFARTETRMFFDHVWLDAHGLFFIKGRLTFRHVSGDIPSHNAGAPSVLIAYGKNNAEILSNYQYPGVYVPLCQI